MTEDQGKAKILDVLRRRYVALTPEEWVRQHFVHYLIEHKHYPAALLANEVRLTIGDKSVRADSVLYDASLHARMIRSTRRRTSLSRRRSSTRSAYITCCSMWIISW